jgi:predicted MFS family arabinose efflux permease
MSSISDLPRLRAILRRPGVAAFLGGRFLAAMGIWSERIAIGWLVWERTGSTALLGLAALLKLGPAIFLAPVGGVVADRIGAVGLLRGCYALNAGLALAFAGFAFDLPLWGVLALTTGLGCVQAVAAAPIKSVVPQIVPREDLPVAYPLSSATFNLAAFVGPAAAGIAIAVLGLWAAFAISVAGALVFVALLGRWSGTDRRAAPSEAHWLGEIGDATSFVLRDGRIGPVFGLHVAASLCLRPFVDLLPAHVARIGGGGPAMLGFATSAFGLGAVLGAIWMAAAAMDQALARRLLAGTAVAIACLMAIAGDWSALPFLAAATGFGAAMMVRGTATLTLIQLAAPETMRGRVSGLYSMVIRGGAAIGAALIGLAAVPLGIPGATVGAALVCLVALALCWPRLSHPDPTNGA